MSPLPRPISTRADPLAVLAAADIESEELIYSDYISFVVAAPRENS